MSDLQTFRHYTICQDLQGTAVEVWRDADEVACLAFDNKQRVFVELHVAIGPAERQRDAASFQKLVQLAAPLRHRHLLGIIEGGEDEGANYHVSEYLDGERLDSWLARSHPLPPWLALLVIRQLVEGLAALAGHPRLLAGVEVFHAGLTLAGSHPDDLTVKICDLGLSGSQPASSEPQFTEARAIHETGRLLLYMLTGTLTEGPVTTEILAGRQIPPELGFLLNTLFTATAPHHPRTLEQLRTLTERCTQDLSPELTSRPDTLPAAYRPRLPLTPHFPDAAETAEILSNDFTLDTRAPDAANPYRHRGTERSTRRAVNVQVLPPPHLLPSPFILTDLEKAWAVPTSGRDPHLLAPLAFHSEGRSPLVVEELPGKWTLEHLRRLRQPLEPDEVLLILTQLDAAALAAESLGLSLHWQSPLLIPLQFTGPGGEAALPPAAKLARLPLTEWPAFTLKVRTWPIALNFTQPDRFHLERLLPRDPALTGEAAAHRPATSPSPTTRDFALLTTWLLGGTPRIRENLKPLLYAAISSRGPAPSSRASFLERFRQRLASPPTAPVPVRHGPADSAPTGTLTLGKSKARLKTTPVPGPVPGKKSRSGKPDKSSSPDTSRGAPTHLHPASGETAAPGTFLFGSAPDDTEPEVPTMGFAEALFGAPDPTARPETDPSPVPGYSTAPVWPAFSNPDAAGYPDFDHDPAAPPLGFMEAAGQSSQPWSETHYDEDTSSQSHSRWMLFLVVILIAAALAALMAQLSGQAIWLK